MNQFFLKLNTFFNDKKESERGFTDFMFLSKKNDHNFKTFDQQSDKNNKTVSFSEFLKQFSYTTMLIWHFPRQNYGPFFVVNGKAQSSFNTDWNKEKNEKYDLSRIEKKGFMA